MTTLSYKHQMSHIVSGVAHLFWRETPRDTQACATEHNNVLLELSPFYMSAYRHWMGFIYYLAGKPMTD